MDPNACWQLFLDACGLADLDSAVNAIQDLTDWLEKGGPSPHQVSADAVYHLRDWLVTAMDL